MQSAETASGAVESLLPFRDPTLPEAARVEDLLGRLTREEKIRCLSTVPDVPRLGVQGSGHVEGLHGLALGTAGDWGQGGPLPTTQFPQAYGLGESWDADLLRRVGEAEGIEVRHLWDTLQRGGLVVRAPNADLARDPRWGRTEESYGEDPFLVGTLAAAFSRGLQGDDPRRLRCASLLKHFCSNSNENGRGHTSSDYDERLLHEYYAEPFRRAIVEGRAQGFMAAYNAVNGVPCTVHPMLKDVTVRQWGHDGIICTDGGAYGMLLTEHKRYATKAEAAAACVKAGINQFLDTHERGTRAALHLGLLADADLDAVLRGVFRVMLRVGQLDPPERIKALAVPADTPSPWDSEGHKNLALEAVLKSAVLLKNDGLLPLRVETLKRVAVIGPHAHEVVSDWYGGDPPYRVSPLQGLRERLAGAEVLHHDGSDRAAAAALAAGCDAVIVCIGNHPLGHGGWDKVDSSLEGKECIDRQDIGLRDEDLYQAVLAANPRSVLALICSFPVACPWSAKNAPAILHLTHSGQDLGRGMAQLLLGDACPGGRLNQTWPRSLDQLPPMLDYDLSHGRTYLYNQPDPLFEFGFGLSYTRFEWGGLSVGAPSLGPRGSVTVSLEVVNGGPCDGDEVVQLYARHPESRIPRPLQALKAFARVAVPKGGRRTVELTLKAADLAHWDAARQAWSLEPGPVDLLLGASSRDIRLRGRVELTA